MRAWSASVGQRADVDRVTQQVFDVGEFPLATVWRWRLALVQFNGQRSSGTVAGRERPEHPSQRFDFASSLFGYQLGRPCSRLAETLAAFDPAGIAEQVTQARPDQRRELPD